MQLKPETHQQIMMCLGCLLASEVPDEYFPQQEGLWDRPCPRCEKFLVWVTDAKAREKVS
jgi:hypothetical protein